MRPPNTSLSGCSRYSNQVATQVTTPPPRKPTHPPPPRDSPPRHTVAATANRNLQAGFARERNRFDDVRRAVATRDQRGPLVDQAVVDLARLFVALVIRV